MHWMGSKNKVAIADPIVPFTWSGNLDVSGNDLSGGAPPVTVEGAFNGEGNRWNRRTKLPVTVAPRTQEVLRDSSTVESKYTVSDFCEQTSSSSTIKPF